MRNPEYSIYGAAKVDNEGGLDAGEDRFNEVGRHMSVAPVFLTLVLRHAHSKCVQSSRQLIVSAYLIRLFWYILPMVAQVCA